MGEKEVDIIIETFVPIIDPWQISSTKPEIPSSNIYRRSDFFGFPKNELCQETTAGKHVDRQYLRFDEYFYLVSKRGTIQILVQRKSYHLD